MWKTLPDRNRILNGIGERAKRYACSGRTLRLCLTTGAVDLASLSTQQLSQVKKQLDDELEHLSSSFSQLRNAQAKFRECLKAMAAGVSPKLDRMLSGRSSRESSTVLTYVYESEKRILVPLTTSLYVPGVLADMENVIVDAGTGFYVEKVCAFLCSGSNRAKDFP